MVSASVQMITGNWFWLHSSLPDQSGKFPDCISRLGLVLATLANSWPFLFSSHVAPSIISMSLLVKVVSFHLQNKAAADLWISKYGCNCCKLPRIFWGFTSVPFFLVSSSFAESLGFFCSLTWVVPLNSMVHLLGTRHQSHYCHQFLAIGFLNEVNAFKPSSLLIYF